LRTQGKWRSSGTKMGPPAAHSSNTASTTCISQKREGKRSSRPMEANAMKGVALQKIFIATTFRAGNHLLNPPIVQHRLPSP
jgi:hypothetical protein